MTTTFKIVPHSIRPGVDVVEIWFGDKMVATLYPRDGGCRLDSKHLVHSKQEPRIEGVDAFSFFFSGEPQ